MSRIFVAVAATVFIAAAAPVSALPFQVNFPVLTYPTQPSPDVDKGCANLTTLSGDTCVTTTK